MFLKYIIDIVLYLNKSGNKNKKTKNIKNKKGVNPFFITIRFTTHLSLSYSFPSEFSRFCYSINFTI